MPAHKLVGVGSQVGNHSMQWTVGASATNTGDSEARGPHRPRVSRERGRWPQWVMGWGRTAAGIWGQQCRGPGRDDEMATSAARTPMEPPGDRTRWCLLSLAYLLYQP